MYIIIYFLSFIFRNFKTYIFNILSLIILK